MCLIIKYYSNSEEKFQLKKEANLRGETNIHCDYVDKNKKATDGNSGRLTFKKIVSVITEKQKRKFELEKKLDSRNISHDELVELLSS